MEDLLQSSGMETLLTCAVRSLIMRKSRVSLIRISMKSSPFMWPLWRSAPSDAMAHHMRAGQLTAVAGLSRIAAAKWERALSPQKVSLNSLDSWPTDSGLATTETKRQPGEGFQGGYSCPGRIVWTQRCPVNGPAAVRFIFSFGWSHNRQRFAVYQATCLKRLRPLLRDA